MTTRVFYSTDSGAPALDGTAGSLVNVLKTCLVGTAGIAYSGKPACGWTAPYVGTNKVALRNDTSSGATGQYFRIDDATGDGRYARFRNYASMTDVDTGLFPMPLTSGKFSGGGWLYKSDTASSATRHWVLVADELTCYFRSQFSTTYNSHAFIAFGDYDSWVPADPSPVFCMFAQFDSFSANGPQDYALNASSSGTFARSLDYGVILKDGYSPTDTPVGFYVPKLGVSSGGHGYTNVNTSPGNDPSQGTGLRTYMPAFVMSEGIVRGQLRGLRVPVNGVSTYLRTQPDFMELDTGVPGEPVGSSLLLMLSNPFVNANYDCAGAIETALAW